MKPWKCDFSKMPPPLPPPRYVEDGTIGGDQVWDWGNSKTRIDEEINSTSTSGINTPPLDFWSGGSPTSRQASVRSRSSSMNSSLRGYQIFDPQEQEPTFLADDRRASSTDISQTSPGLLPPPVKIGRVLSFRCDICLDAIHVKRRLEWQ